MDERIRAAIAAMLAMQRHPWEQGVCAQALYEAGLEEYWLPMAYDCVKRQSPDGRLGMLYDSVAVSDPASCGEVCWRAWEKTGNRLFLEGAQRMLNYLLNVVPRTPEGIVCHNEVSFEEGFSPKQLWIDGAYMVPPFMAVMGGLEAAARQIRGYCDALQDKETGLFFHIYDAGGRVFVRRRLWATGNGWLLMGLARLAQEAQLQSREDLRDEMNALSDTVLKAMLRYQREDGRFHDILDDETSFVDGTSGLMMSAAVFRRVSLGMLDAGALPYAEAAYQGALSKIDGMGILHEVCGCPDFVRQGTSAEAQAALIMAYAWRCRAMKEDN